MTLDTLKSYLEMDTPSYTQQCDHIASLNAARADFAIPLKEIRLAPTGGMLLPRSRYRAPPGHADKAAWTHITNQIQEWVALIERHEQHHTVSWPQRCLKWAKRPLYSIITSVIGAGVMHYLGWDQG
ncbi:MULTISPECIES: hypothetical protein [Yersinia pseudotuberculosis complex]|uniref:Uncharacterized protein n=1 Tax=Yersinia pseudotuberculosis serotype O:1b (strain IP 31758) TaxID=349747 RepID=A0A0U1QTI4_YERP3|nr:MULTISPECIES: hypothetical protein [Yersinia pseudotuberculosis complex]ABS45693.1 hypothetical protein YpsIP31758_B0133 [Yersinia pseudotuberculosis IP 31758]MCE4113302.1 hypothetical protein [Yersinia pseudotuberculosis]UFA64147.1 Uncharacterized protein YP598_4540 [Yersinia pseudotuberculosis]WLF06087.1 hypothetical protein Q6G25_20930 [Yersinia pseudotuberculosis]